MKNKILILLCVFCAFGLQAQEFQTVVTINTPKLQTADPKVFKTLEGAIKDFMNGTSWTDLAYDNYEKIEVNFTINIREEVNQNTFRGDLAIQVVRPVFGSDYETPLFSYVDKDFVFSYEQFQPIIYTKGVFNDNLSSMLSFFAYYILGTDYDSYSSMGGDPYFLLAQDVVNLVPQSVSSSFGGWTSISGNRCRYFLLENALNPGMRAIRQGTYDYHRKGLDLMSTDPQTARNNMVKALEYYEAVNKSYPNTTAIQLIGSTKSDEIISVFKGGETTQRAKVNQVMSKIDPTGAQKYLQLAF